MTDPSPILECPPDWDESIYLAKNPDVRAAVEKGGLPSGYHHYVLYGMAENREDGFTDAGENGGGFTKSCMDPWNNLEVAASGELRPCCISPPLREQDVLTIDRNSEEFRSLRAELLAGELRPMCASCHIRSTVSRGRFRRQVESEAAQSKVEPLSPMPLRSLRVDVNEQCNLRCTYCAVSQPGYVGKKMASEVFGSVVNLIAGNRSARVDLNGHGETSFHPDWLEYAEQIHALGVRTSILSNFAKIFTPAEAAAFARMELIQISIDSTNEALLKAVRRKVSFATIRLNVGNIRATARTLGLEPRWSISCGVYDQNVAGIRKLAEFAIEEGFHSVTFWNLVEHAPLEDVVSAKPIAALAPAQRIAAVQEINSVVALLRGAGVLVEIPDTLTQAVEATA